MGNRPGTCCTCAHDSTGTVVEKDTDYQHLSWSYGTPRAPGEKEEMQTPAQEAAASEDQPKPEHADAPPEDLTSCNFTIKLAKKDSSEPWGFGLKKSPIDDTLLIINPVGRALAAWEKANPTKKLKMCDEIISVNGVSGSVSILEILKTSVELDITIRRLRRITMEFVKNGPLGMTIVPGTLAVRKLTDGMMKTYNGLCAPPRAISEGDRLVSVNDTKMQDSNHILATFANIPDGAEIKLVFARDTVS